MLNSQRGFVTTNELAFYRKITDYWAQQANLPAPPPSPVPARPPVALPGTSRVVGARQWVFLLGQGRAYSPARIVSYHWRQVSGPPVTIYRFGHSAIIIRSPAYPSQLAFQLTVTDSHGRAGAQTVKVTVH